ncbi:MAG: hypothetical protein ILP02_00075 [Clostridia bacterium]|nr:hypothetical protein [Clostridia bacterium]
MKDTVKRAQAIIDSDRFGFVSGSKEMILADIEDVLSQYFYLPHGLNVKLEPTGDTFTLEICAKGCSLRSFNVLK